MNFSISHDSEVEVFVFPFPFLEDSPVLGAINGNGKTKSLCFYHTKLRILLALPRAIEERIDDEEEEMEEREKGLCFGQEEKRGLCCVKMKKNGGVYIVEGEGVGSAI